MRREREGGRGGGGGGRAGKFSGAGLSVILVCDIRRPRCHHSLDVRIGFCAACRPPRDWLQRLQTVRVFSRVSSPPCAWGTMWSASALAGVLDTA